MVLKNGKVEYEPVIDFWVAPNRQGLLNYLTNQYPKDIDNLIAMPKAKLTQIYINTRKKRG